MSQGRINAQVTRLADKPEQLIAFMEGKTDEEKRQARSHLKTVRALRKK